MTAADLYRQEIIEEVIPEPISLNEETLVQVTEVLDKEIASFLEIYKNYTEEELLEKRYKRFRKF